MRRVKYQYHVQVWGGFFNPEFQLIHGKSEGDFLFNTDEDREVFIQELRSIEKNLGANYLMVNKTEGYHCDVRTVLHRVTKYQGKETYTTRDLGINYPIDSARYMMENKWYPGHNDYPLGVDFDYDGKSHEITYDEWITGAFEYD